MVMKLNVAGKLNTACFHKAKALAESLDGPNFVVTTQAMLPCGYERYLEEVKLDLGGDVWAHKKGVIVISDEGYIGDEDALIRWMRTRKLSLEALNSNGQAVSWEQVAEAALAEYMATSGNDYAFLDVDFDGQPIGRMLFELYSSKLPKTCANFLKLCTGGGKTPAGHNLHYLGTPIHRIVKDAWIQGGDVVSGNGSGGASAFGDSIPDESFCIPHDSAGIIGMANVGAHSASSQFYVTLRALPSFDLKSVAFGRLIDGSSVLDFLGSLDCKMERPEGEVRICSCGKLKVVEMGTYDQQVAAAKLQAIQRSRAVRKEAADKDAAAAKMQAIQKGRATRKNYKKQ